MTDHTDIVERLENFCTDWDGSAMNDHTTPMDGLHCLDLREAAAEITRLRAEAEALRNALAIARNCILTDRTSLADTHMNPVTNKVDDEDGIAGLAEYDEVLAAIDATKGTT